jgi:hypothetical protein
VWRLFSKSFWISDYFEALSFWNYSSLSCSSLKVTLIYSFKYSFSLIKVILSLISFSLSDSNKPIFSSYLVTSLLYSIFYSLFYMIFSKLYILTSLSSRSLCLSLTDCSSLTTFSNNYFLSFSSSSFSLTSFVILSSILLNESFV